MVHSLSAGFGWVFVRFLLLLMIGVLVVVRFFCLVVFLGRCFGFLQVFCLAGLVLFMGFFCLFGWWFCFLNKRVYLQTTQQRFLNKCLLKLTLNIAPDVEYSGSGHHDFGSLQQMSL